MRPLAALFTATLLVLPSISLEGQLSLADGGELTFEIKKPNHLKGSFQRGDVIARFESSYFPDEQGFGLFDAHGVSVVQVTVTQQRVDARILDGRLRAVGARTEEGAILELVEGSSDSEEAYEGVIRALIENEAYGILPNLAIELFRREMVGGDVYPAAQFVHGIAVASARARDLRMPELERPSANRCRDLREDPHANRCYSMCGNECTCWWPVCLTCCGCEGCYTHDLACRIIECKDVGLSREARKASEVGCLTFAAFFVSSAPCKRFLDEVPTPPC